MLKALVKGFVILAVTVLLLGYVLFNPKYATELTFEGEEITIVRNQNNIPNIKAQTRKGFLYGMGTAQAEDRLFQMTFKSLVVQGRLSEFMGEKPLKMDKFMREINLRGWASKMANRLLKENRTQYQQLQAFVKGINDHVATLKILPLDFLFIGYKWENWTVVDVCSQFKLLQWSQGMGGTDQLAKNSLVQEFNVEKIEKFLVLNKQNWAFNSTVIVADDQIPQSIRGQSSQNKKHSAIKFSPEILKQYRQLGLLDLLLPSSQGSNCFAISGEHTQSGRPLLAHDPHLENVIPSQWYQLQGSYYLDDKLISFSGVSSSGLTVIVGKGDYLAFGVTTIYTDNQDFYKQKIEDNKYLVNGKWHNLKQREEIIKIKGKQSLNFSVKQTHRGPIISYFPSTLGSFQINEPISLRWTGFIDEYSALVLTSHVFQALDLQTVTQYLLNETEHAMNVNIVYITSDNHIGYTQLGKYPLRNDAHHSSYIKNGTTTDHDWLGFLPKYHRMHIVDPKSGYIVSSNNRIASEKHANGLNERTIFTARSDRLHQMIRERIKNGKRINVGDMKQMVLDTVDVYCRQMLPFINDVFGGVISPFGLFDCNFTKDSFFAAIYEVFFYELHHRIKPHKAINFSVLSLHLNAQYLYNYIKESKSNEEKKKIIIQALMASRQHLIKFFGSKDVSQWKWGKFHKDAMHHLPFGNTPLKFFYDRQFDGFGNMHTVNVGKMNKVEMGNFETSHRANYRAIYSFEGENLWIIDSGSSQKVFSKHYDDQWELFQRNQFIPIQNPVNPIPPTRQQQL